jgi:hypothetical protein
MGTAGAFLGQIKILIKVDGVVRTGIHTISASRTSVWIDDYKAVITFIDRALCRTDIHTRRVIAMHAQMGTVGHLDFGDRTAYLFGQLNPELPDFRLGLCNGRPIITTMLVLTGKLAGMATVAD